MNFTVKVKFGHKAECSGSPAGDNSEAPRTRGTSLAQFCMQCSPESSGDARGRTKGQAQTGPGLPTFMCVETLGI